MESPWPPVSFERSDVRVNANEVSTVADGLSVDPRKKAKDRFDQREHVHCLLRRRKNDLTLPVDRAVQFPCGCSLGKSHRPREIEEIETDDNLFPLLSATSPRCRGNRNEKKQRPWDNGQCMCKQKGRRRRQVTLARNCPFRKRIYRRRRRQRCVTIVSVRPRTSFSRDGCCNYCT